MSPSPPGRGSKFLGASDDDDDDDDEGKTEIGDALAPLGTEAEATKELRAPARSPQVAAELPTTPGVKIPTPKIAASNLLAAEPATTPGLKIPPPKIAPLNPNLLAGEEAMPLLTAAVAEDVSRPPPRPSAPAVAPAPKPSRPAVQPPPAPMPEPRPSRPQPSAYEQLEAMEQAERAAATIKPSLAARAELFEAPPPPPPNAAPPEPAPEPMMDGGMRMLDYNDPALGAGPDAPSAPRKQWTGGVDLEDSGPRKPPRVKPGDRAPQAPRPYVPLTAPAAEKRPPLRTRTVVLTAVLAALVGVLIVEVMVPGDPEILADPIPAPPVVAPIVVKAAPVAPLAAPGTVKFSGVPKGAKVSVDGAAVADPAVEKELTTGEHRVVVELKGYPKFETTVAIVRGEVKVVEVALKKAKKKK